LAFPLGDEQEYQIPHAFVQLGRMKRDVEVPTFKAANGSVNVIPRLVRREAEAASGHQASQAPDDVPERDARREHVAGGP
jgi:hypothetical protein